MKTKILLMWIVISTTMLIAQNTIDNPFFEKVSYRGAFGTTDWTSGWSNYDPQNTAYGATTVTIAAGNITTNITWTKNNVYLLNGWVYVKDGATLTIEAGTVIRADKTNKGSLIIEKGAKLIANGTATEPIVFTSNKPIGSRFYGDWGGVIFCGKAPINPAGGSATIEGGVSTYGGTDATDNSGCLQYVRIEFPGIAFATNSEINGLTLAGVGSGTTIDNIQVSYSGDDSFEWFGGTVNVKHLIAYRGWDDDFDTDQGYSGMVQYAVSLRDPAVADQSKSNCFESDNDASGSANIPFTSPVFSNVSSFGPKVTEVTTFNALYANAMHLRRNSKIKIYNSIFAGWKTGLYIDGITTQENALVGDLKLRNIVLAGMTVANFGVPASQSWNIVAERAWYNGVTFKNDTIINNTDLKVEDPFNLTAPKFTLKSSSGMLINSYWGNIAIDTKPPTVPSGLMATNITSTSLTLSWTASTDSVGVAKYLIYNNGSLLIDSTAFATTITLNNLTPNTPFSFTLKAKDAAGNVSAASSSLVVSTLKIPEYADLQVTSVQLPTQLIADRKAIITATISNNGKADIIGKSWIDHIYISKDTVFNKANATLLGTITHTSIVQKDSSYLVTFQITAPSNTLNSFRFVVETDELDSVYESNQDNNITSSDWIKLLPNTIDITEYQALCYFFSTSSGYLWKQKWNLLSNTINPINWPGVSFEDGHVTAISLPSNQIQGGLPLVLFTLPKLRDLNLSENQLTSRIDSTITNATLINSFKTDSLVSLNFSKNLLEGEIPSILKMFTHLKSLNLEGNRLYAISTPLPLSITSLNLQNQIINVDSIKLSLIPSILFPPLFIYNHTTQSFDFRPSFSLINNGALVGGVYFNGSSYQLYTSNQIGWIYDSGQSFMLRQENGLTSGSTLIFKIFFDKGDANIDQKVDILDVQHSLNNLLGDNPQPFNFAAADTYKDTLITVQDIVKTVNIVLSSTESTSTNLQKSKMVVQSANQLYIENNKLVLDIEQPVAAMDILLEGITDKQIRLTLSSSKFQLIARNLPEVGTRFIVFSPNGNEIQTGKTIIAELYNENAAVSSAKLSDKAAQPMLVTLIKTDVTGFDNLMNIGFSAYCIAHKAYVSLPSNVQKLRATLYSAQGIMLDDRIMENLASGKFMIDYSSFATKSGVYLLKIAVNTKDGIRELNTKLIISK